LIADSFPNKFMDCRIRAFGACMIGGFPHRYEDSFFHLTFEWLRPETATRIIPTIYTMGGFPVTRVAKHLPTRCLTENPDIVVLQFATSDLIVPIRKDHRHHGHSSSPAQRKVTATAATPAHHLKWWLRSFYTDALRLPPVTPPEAYLATMTFLTRTLLEHQVIPVVLSPFVFGGGRSDRLACDCSSRLQAAVASLPRAVYVDAALARQPRAKMLLSDGTHLSLAGQRVVADALFPCLKNLVTNQSWFVKNSPPSPPPRA
jgi:hypothetical protein